jgi:toxin-antitoxin system PIN domain toxin
MRNAMFDTSPEIDLLDVNVWLALVDENHTHHTRARRYWELESAQQIAFTRVTMLGMVRLLTNRVVMNQRPFSASEAWSAYRAFRALPEIIWIGEHENDARIADELLESWISVAEKFSTLHWTDAHLASISVASGCRLVSFDGGYRRYPGVDFLHLA